MAHLRKLLSCLAGSVLLLALASPAPADTAADLRQLSGKYAALVEDVKNPQAVPSPDTLGKRLGDLNSQALRLLLVAVGDDQPAEARTAAAQLGREIAAFPDKAVPAAEKSSVDGLRVKVENARPELLKIAGWAANVGQLYARAGVPPPTPPASPWAPLQWLAVLLPTLFLGAILVRLTLPRKTRKPLCFGPEAAEEPESPPAHTDAPAHVPDFTILHNELRGLSEAHEKRWRWLSERLQPVDFPRLSADIAALRSRGVGTTAGSTPATNALESRLHGLETSMSVLADENRSQLQKATAELRAIAARLEPPPTPLPSTAAVPEWRAHENLQNSRERFTAAVQALRSEIERRPPRVRACCETLFRLAEGLAKLPEAELGPDWLKQGGNVENLVQRLLFRPEYVYSPLVTQPEEAELRALLQAEIERYQSHLVRVLHRAGVELIVPLPLDKYSGTDHKITCEVPAWNPAQHKHIKELQLPGLRVADRVLRPALVACFMFSEGAPGEVVDPSLSAPGEDHSAGVSDPAPVSETDGEPCPQAPDPSTRSVAPNPADAEPIVPDAGTLPGTTPRSSSIRRQYTP